MKLCVMSDLHLEFNANMSFFNKVYHPMVVDLAAKGEIDVIVLAGDISYVTPMKNSGVMSVKDVIEVYFAPLGLPIIYVPGNHEFYNGNYTRDMKALHAFHAELGWENKFHLLDGTSVMIDDTLFVGGILWTNFLLYGETNKIAAKSAAKRNMNDYRLISDGDYPFTPDKAAEECGRIVFGMESTIEHSELEIEKLVFVTHHGFSLSCISDGYKRTSGLLNAAYSSNLDRMIDRFGPNAWIFGHTHHNMDKMFGDTRVVNNSLGYAGYEFDMRINDRRPMVVEV